MSLEQAGLRALQNVIESENGCLLSQYSVGSHGYAQVGWWSEDHSTVTTAHRAVWSYLYGDPGELVVDHLCRVKVCVNPDHLQLLTRGENSSKGSGEVIGCRNGHHPSWWRKAGKHYRCHGCHVERQRKRRGQQARVDYTKEAF